jgi:molybdopterin/thiamine biosynthesis adenylyltransferase
MMLNQKQKDLYSRHLLISDFSDLDQQKLMKAKVLVIGAGGLGSPVLFYLAAAGIRNIGIVDSDSVELNNLQRQILFSESDIGKFKVDITASKLKSLNTDCVPVKFCAHWNEFTAPEIVNGYSLIIDCTDNIKARITTDKITRKLGIPFVYGAVDGWEGQVSVFNFKGSKPYCEIFGFKNDIPEQVPVGVVGVTPAVTGSIMAAEAIKIILNKGDILYGKMLHISLLNNKWEVYNL